ncbi:MAG TPA: hypothetical protein VEQ60_20310 [Longimicrobium sp.]|nr:hypothetical protein [Longimicrobium sp.]
MSILAPDLGVRLQLWMGETLPVPVGREVIAALQSVSVQSGGGDSDGFQLTFRAARDTVLDYSLIDTLGLMKRVSLGVLFGARPEPLIEGVITNHQFTPSGEPGASTLTVSGRDVSVMLDLEEKNYPYRNQPDGVIAGRVLAPYIEYGMVPAPTQTTVVPIEVQEVPWQTGTDLAFLRHLAQRNGFVFYVRPVGFGASIAYWGPETRGAELQPALTVGMGPHSNVEGLHFTTEALAPVGVKGSILEPTLGFTIPIPALPPLKVPPLALIPVPARRTRLKRDTAQASAASAAVSVVAESTNAPDAVTGSGQLDAVRYGRVLRARERVGVRGVGITHDGLYYVESVSHSISVGRFTTSFSLKREGTWPLLPMLPT